MIPISPEQDVRNPFRRYAHLLTLVWFGVIWSLELYQQTVARLWRQGQESGTRGAEYYYGRLEIDNNRAERSIKPFVIGRKNFLFANTESGATGSAVMYSIIETAKENNLDPFKYLTYIFSKFPNLKEDETVDTLLPWNAPEECKAKT